MNQDSKRSFRIKVDGIEREVSKVQGHVVNVRGFNEEIKIAPVSGSSMVGGKIPSYTTGYQKELIIKMLSSGDELSFRFKGNSPLRGGDYIGAGLFAGGDLMHSALYLEIMGDDGSWRRDYRDGYNPTHSEVEELGLI